MFGEHAIYERPGYEPMVGWEAIRRFYERTRSIVSGQHDLHSIVTQDEHVAVAGQFVGVLRDHRHTNVEFADFFEIADQSIIRRKTFFGVPAV